MINKQMLHRKDGYLYLDKERKRGVFGFYGAGKTKRGIEYSYVRLHDTAETLGEMKEKVRFYWRRRRITDYDRQRGTVTNHIDIIPETIPQLIEMLSVLYEDITGGKLTPKTPAEMVADKTKEDSVKDKEDEIIKDMGGGIL